MEIPKDLYDYLTQFADDKTILEMIRVNKKYSNPAFFEKVMKRKYPLLLQFKKDDESMKRFYLKMIFYISKLQEKYEFPYPNTPDLNPEKFYKFLTLLDKKLKELESLPFVEIDNNFIRVRTADNVIYINKNYNGEIFYEKAPLDESGIIEVKYDLPRLPTAKELIPLFNNEDPYAIELVQGPYRISSIQIT